MQLFIPSQVEINCREVSCLVHRDRWASATHVTPPTTCARRPSFNFMRSWARTAVTRSRRKIFYCLYFFLFDCLRSRYWILWIYFILWKVGWCLLLSVVCFGKGMVQLEMSLHLIYCLLKKFICSFLPTQLLIGGSIITRNKINTHSHT